MWKWKCPICEKYIEEDFEFDYIQNECVGHTHDCPECGGLVLINENGICTNFEAVINRVYDQICEMEKNGEIVLDEETDEYVEVDKKETDK